MPLLQEVQNTFVLLLATWTIGKANLFIKQLKFTHVIVYQAEPEKQYYLFTQGEAYKLLQESDNQGYLFEVISDRGEQMVPALDIRTDSTDIPKRTIFLEEGQIVGFRDRKRTFARTRSARNRRRRSWSRSAQRFAAYPLLDAPIQVEPEEAFTIFVGFQDDQKLLPPGTPPIIVEHPRDGATILVILVGDGVDVIGSNHGELALTMEARLQFIAHARPNIKKATISAQYFYDNQMIGMISRDIIVIQPEITQLSELTEPNTCRLGSPDPTSYIDLTVTISKSRDGSFQWILNAAQPSIMQMPEPIYISDTKQFAGDLITDLKRQYHKGILAANLLEVYGQRIAENMPMEFFDVLRQVAAAVDHPPSLLFVTDEHYIPWELAWLDEPIDTSKPSFLAAQTQMARWLLNQKVAFPPPVTIDIHRLTAVASRYGLGTSLRELTEAMAEQAMLSQQWNAIPLEAKLADLEALLWSYRISGHLIHFAVHGLSNPQANEQMLFLADGKQLVAGALTGAYKRGDVPRFAFVFLNACQVATTGASLGQAAGFPADLIRGGTLGFIAPLWEVDDKIARMLAEMFYTETLHKSQSVSRILQEYRCTYETCASTTPMAYIFYGHPLLRLNDSRS